VGPCGVVVGVDREARAVEAARACAERAKPGGVVAFLVPALHVDLQSETTIDLLRLALESLVKFFPALPKYDIRAVSSRASRTPGCPSRRSCGVNYDRLRPADVAMDLVNVHPGPSAYERMGLVHREVGDPSTLCDRILAAASGSRAQLVSASFVSAWSIRSCKPCEAGLTPAQLLADSRFFRDDLPMGPSNTTRR
jgi:hypothetical protein